MRMIWLVAALLLSLPALAKDKTQAKAARTPASEAVSGDFFCSKTSFDPSVSRQTEITYVESLTKALNDKCDKSKNYSVVTVPSVMAPDLTVFSYCCIAK